MGDSWFTGNSIQDAVLWNETTPTIIPVFGGAGGSIAYGINDSNEVVGNSWLTGNTAQHGFLYASGTVYDLNSVVAPGSGVTNIRVAASGDVINNLGQISAYGTYNGQTVAVLLTPTPEPASAVFMAFGASMLLMRRGKHRQRVR